MNDISRWSISTPHCNFMIFRLLHSKLHVQNTNTKHNTQARLTTHTHCHRQQNFETPLFFVNFGFTYEGEYQVKQSELGVSTAKYTTIRGGVPGFSTEPGSSTP